MRNARWLARGCACGVVACTESSLGAPLGPPPNDGCADASPIGDGDTPFSNFGATTDGPAPCDLLMGSDIWYEYQATCTGNWRVEVCGSDFDTVLAAYDGSGCPVGAPLDCNDDFDFCGDGLQSILNVPVVAGNTYKLQVGGFKGNQGSGTIVSSCSIIQCPWDLDGDQLVGITDLLDLLAAWGNPWGITDLLDLLASWGACP